VAQCGIANCFKRPKSFKHTRSVALTGDKEGKHKPRCPLSWLWPPHGSRGMHRAWACAPAGRSSLRLWLPCPCASPLRLQARGTWGLRVPRGLRSGRSAPFCRPCKPGPPSICRQDGGLHALEECTANASAHERGLCIHIRADAWA